MRKWHPTRFEWRRLAATFFLCWSAAQASPALAADFRVFREYEIKAAFLYNFVIFTEWPASAFSNERAPVVVGVWGRNPFGTHLDKVINGKTVGPRRLVFKPCSLIEEARACHLLFVSASERDRLSSIFDALKGTSVLTVGDMENFAARGGMINLVVSNRAVRLQINPEAARRAGLRISSQVLELADIVQEGASSERK